jgi:hypothetical protein
MYGNHKILMRKDLYDLPRKYYDMAQPPDFTQEVQLVFAPRGGDTPSNGGDIISTSSKISPP